MEWANAHGFAGGMEELCANAVSICTYTYMYIDKQSVLEPAREWLGPFCSFNWQVVRKAVLDDITKAGVEGGLKSFEQVRVGGWVGGWLGCMMQVDEHCHPASF